MIAATIANKKPLNGTAANRCDITGEAVGRLEITGIIAAVESITVEVGTGDTLSGAAASKGSLTGKLATAYAEGAEKYDGPYDVTPKVDKQQLKTKRKYMTDDVKIQAIPYFEVSNTTGGNTVYIANEIEFE